jgi:DeoR/GlpR family transcriptional regulator of sugar metabolism
VTTSDNRVPLQVARRAQLLEALRRNAALRITDLTEALGAATVTIRRDIVQFAAEGLVRRAHGGVALIAADDAPSPPTSGRPSRSRRSAGAPSAC